MAFVFLLLLLLRPSRPASSCFAWGWTSPSFNQAVRSGQVRSGRVGSVTWSQAVPLARSQGVNSLGSASRRALRRRSSLFLFFLSSASLDFSILQEIFHNVKTFSFIADMKFHFIFIYSFQFSSPRCFLRRSTKRPLMASR